MTLRRCGREVEGTPLLREHAAYTRIEGSNPSISAKNSTFKPLIFKGFFVSSCLVSRSHWPSTDQIIFMIRTCDSWSLDFYLYLHPQSSVRNHALSITVKLWPCCLATILSFNLSPNWFPPNFSVYPFSVMELEIFTQYDREPWERNVFSR